MIVAPFTVIAAVIVLGYIVYKAAGG